jgi:hypothetical protein
MQYSNSLDAHRLQLAKYLVRDGTGRDGSGASLYGSDPDEYRENMVAKNFRIFLSPQSDKVNLTELTEKFVKNLELQTGYKLYWQAANHYNTAHPHAHLLVNGKDQNGKDVVFPRDIVKTFMREAARDICTGMTGKRTRADLDREKEAELRASRFTRTDETIRELCDGRLRLDPRDIKGDKERIVARLDTLRKLKVCSYQNGGYRFSPNWEEGLRANGRYNAFLSARDMLRFSAPAGLKVYTGKEGEITGRVAKVFRTDGDASDNHAVVVEGLDGKAFFVPLFNKPELRAGGKIAEGDFLTVKAPKAQKGRLTPVMVPREAGGLRREIRRKGYAGALAAEVLKGDKKTGKQALMT